MWSKDSQYSSVFCRWREILSSLDVPSYYTTYSAIVTSLLSLVLPAQVIEPLIIFLLDLFSVNNNTRVFIIQSYLPQILQAFSNIQLSIFEKTALLLSTLTTFTKLVYAFLFQEQTFMIDFLTSPLAIQVATNDEMLSIILSSSLDLSCSLSWMKS